MTFGSVAIDEHTSDLVPHTRARELWRRKMMIRRYHHALCAMRRLLQRIGLTRRGPLA
jgi:hypothetical protein